MKSFNITIIEPWSNREVRHLDVPQSQLKDIDGETWFTGYNEAIEVITAEPVVRNHKLPRQHTSHVGELQMSKLLNIIYEEMGIVCLLLSLTLYPFMIIMGCCILAHLLLRYF